MCYVANCAGLGPAAGWTDVSSSQTATTEGAE